MMKWLVPVIGLAVLALVLYYLFRPGAVPAVPDVAKVSTDVTSTFKSLGDAFTGIKDAASAEAALPKLTDLSGKLDSLKALADKLPEAGRSKITELIKSSYAGLEQTLSSALAIPGVGDKIRPMVTEVMGKLASMGGLPAFDFSATQLTGRVTSIMKSLTEGMGGIKDVATADAALPKLKDISTQLDDMKGQWDNLPQTGKSALSSIIRAALAKLQVLADRVLTIAGVGDRVKPAVDAIIDKLKVFAA